MEKSSDLSCPAVVSRACSHSARRFFHGSLAGFAAAGIGARGHCAPPPAPNDIASVLVAPSSSRSILSGSWLYRVWPQCLNVMVLLKPATVVRWHRQGFRLYWRWRSRSGRPSVDREVRDLIRQMNRANPLWGAPRIHGELLKLGIKVSQATVAKYMVRRIGTPSPTWRSLLRNEAIGIAAIDVLCRVGLVSTAVLDDPSWLTVVKGLCSSICYVASHGSVAFAAGN